MKLRVLGNRLLVKEVIAVQSKGGIVFPESAVTYHQHSPGAKLFTVLQLGEKVTEPIRVGDRVLCHSFLDGPKPVNGDGENIVGVDQVILNMTDHTA